MNIQRSLLLSVLLLSVTAVATAELHEVEQQALRALYSATNGENWVQNDGWSTDGPIDCDAFGLSCPPDVEYFPLRPDADETVVSVNLPANNLDGVLPNDLAQLEYLWDLDLADNNLTGTIPEGLSMLLSINLSNNNLTGEPPSTLWKAHVMTLDLSHNSFNGTIPPEIGILGHTARVGGVAKIDLSNNNFSGSIPGELGSLAWEGREDGILDLSYNLLSGALPVELGEMENPSIIRLDHNALSGNIPADLLSQWPTVCQLQLGFNRFTGEVPIEILQMLNLGVCEGDVSPLGLTFNTLYSQEESVIAFIRSHSDDVLFPETQTQDVTSLQLSSVSDESATLSWEAINTLPVTEGGYRVYLSQSISGPFDFFTSIEGKETTSIQLEGLSPDTNYWVRVHSYSTIDANLYDTESTSSGMVPYSIESNGDTAFVLPFTTELRSKGSGGSVLLVLFLSLFGARLFLSEMNPSTRGFEK